MEIFELAKALGKALKEDSRLIALQTAKEAYAKDADLQRWLVEYDVQQRAMQNEIAKGEARDLQLVEMIQHRVDELYALISENAAFRELNRVQRDVNELMNRVNQTITCEITGEEPGSGCTHDCSTCGGCH